MPEVLATSCSVSSQLCCEKPLRDLQSAGATSPTPAKRGGFFGTLTPLTAADTSLPLAGRPSRPMSTTLRGAWTRPPRGFGATERLGIGTRVGRSHR